MNEPDGQFHIGDSIVVTGTADDGELGTVLEVLPDPATGRYRIILETGREIELTGGNMARRQ
jgi:hypothetical protein